MQGLRLEGKTSINSLSDEWLAVSFEYFLLQKFNIFFPRAYAREENEETFSSEYLHLHHKVDVLTTGQQSQKICTQCPRVPERKSGDTTRLQSWQKPENAAMCFAGQGGRCDVPSWQPMVT